MPHRPDNPEPDAHWRTAGDRIQNLLDASAAGGAVAHERAEQLVREITDLYGAGARADDGHGCRGATRARGGVRRRRPDRQPAAGARVASARRRATDRGRAGQRAAVSRVARRRRPSARGRRRRCPAAVRGQLQELSVVVGHPRARRRGRGARCGAGDLVDRGGGRRSGCHARDDSGRHPDEPDARATAGARVASGARPRRPRTGRGRRVRGRGHHRARVSGR